MRILHYAAIIANVSQQQSGQTSLGHPLEFQSGNSKDKTVITNPEREREREREMSIIQADWITYSIQSFKESPDSVIRIPRTNDLQKSPSFQLKLQSIGGVLVTRIWLIRSLPWI
jgi:hypothetical protein